MDQGTSKPRLPRTEDVSPVIEAVRYTLLELVRGADIHIFTPYMVRLIGSRGSPWTELRRAYLCADIACRVIAPDALRLVALESAACQLEALTPIRVSEDATEAGLAAYTASGAAINTFAPHAVVVMNAVSEAARAAFAAACITKDPPARHRRKGAWIQKAASAGAGATATAVWTAEASLHRGTDKYRTILSGYVAYLMERLHAVEDS